TGLGSVNIGNLANSFSNFTLSSSTTSFTVTSSSPATATVTTTSQNGFTGTINLSCGTLPTGATCSFSPSSVTLSASGSATSTLTITKTSSFVMPAIRGNHRNVTPLMATLAALAAFGIFAFVSGYKRRPAMALVLLGAVLFMAACGGGSST